MDAPEPNGISYSIRQPRKMLIVFCAIGALFAVVSGLLSFVVDDRQSALQLLYVTLFLWSISLVLFLLYRYASSKTKLTFDLQGNLWLKSRGIWAGPVAPQDVAAIDFTRVVVRSTTLTYLSLFQKQYGEVNNNRRARKRHSTEMLEIIDTQQLKALNISLSLFGYPPELITFLNQSNGLKSAEIQALLKENKF
jgi:hypothetical protein